MGNLIGFVGALIVTIIIVAIVEKVAKTNLPYGWIGNIIVGFIGGVIGQYVLGQWGLNIMGVYIVQTFLGSLAFILIAKWIMGQLAKNRK